MMKKRAFSILLVLAILFSVSSILAQDEISIETSYSCLETQLGDNCGGTNNVEQAAFNLMAIGYDSGLQSDCRSTLTGMREGPCWGDSDGAVCKIKPTALAVLALDYVGQDTETAVNWLLTKKVTSTSLTWFLEIDADNETSCTINGASITLMANKKITGSDPSGLRKAYNNYWFEVTDISKNYTISCEKDFITTLLYKKPGSDVFYVSSKTQSAAAHDSVIEKVEAYCFGLSNTCDYEGSLWTVLALAKMEEDISPYMPYLSAMSDESANKKYLPSAFLYMMTGADDYYTALVNQQKQNKYWDESRNKLYDTSVALLGLQGLTLAEIDNAKNYLLDLREEAGCWNSYTSFILASGWPKEPHVTSSGGDTTASCISYGYSCTSTGDCKIEDRLDNFPCPSLSQVCCSVEPVQESCSEKGGIICESDEECTSSEVISEDTNYCCLGECEFIEEEDLCSDVAEYSCETSCSDEQEEKSSYACDYGDVCCAPKQKEKRSLWLIVLLVILIILVVLAIIFRHQLRIWIFRGKGKVKLGNGPTAPGGRPGPGPGRPGLPPPGMGSRGRPRQIIPRRHLPTRRSPAPQGRPRDKDFDDTMKKLKDISK